VNRASFFGHIGLLFTVLVLLSSCGKRDSTVDLVTFPLHGIVTEVDTAASRVTIRHDEIPNYMPAMEMPFKVKNPALLRGLTPGDSIGATLAVSRTESWLETLQVLHKGEQMQVLSADQIEFQHLVREGEEIPDLRLLNQDGKTLRISDFRGKALALTFVYTRCPLPDFCIRMSEHFRQTQQALKSDRSVDGRWHLLSISFDPAFDRPSVLKQYGRNYGADFSDWDFGTDPDTSGKDLASFADCFGLSYAPSEGLIDHNLRTVVVDPRGRLVKVFRGNEWKSEELVEALRRAAG